VKRVLGVDPGERRVGLALSDPLGLTAQPLELLTVAKPEETAPALARIVAEREVGEVVIGLPRNMDYSLGPAAQRSLALVEQLKALVSVPVKTWDERLTTRLADQSFRERGLTRKQRDQRRDVTAAQLLLQSYLDAQKRA